jgi:translation initiation factor 2 subunit 1
MVMRVDEQKGYIDLSKRRVTQEDIAKCEDRYTKGKLVNSIMRHVAHVAGMSLLEANEKMAWPLAKTAYKSTYEALRALLSEPPSVVFAGLNVEERMQSLALSEVKKRLTPQAIRLRADIEVSCFSYEGINAVRAGLLAGLATGTPDSPVVIKLIAPPSYVVLTTSMDKAQGIATLDKAIAAIDEDIKQRGGKLVVKIAPRTTSMQEETALTTLLQQMEQENREVDGDDENEEEGIRVADAEGAVEA